MDKHITNLEATNLQDRCISTRSSIIDNALGYTDVRSFNFSLDELKDYIQEIEDYGAEHSQNNLGITIFLGAYASTDTDPSKSTVFLAASRDDGDITTKEIQPLNYAKPAKNKY